jgi:hypothetical protein
MSNLLQKQRIEVLSEGSLVVLRIGNTDLKMEHELAIQLSTWLRVRGKEAKRIAGDNSRHWSVVGNLGAVIAGEKPW